MSQFVDMTSSPNIFDVILFLLSSLVTDSNLLSISSLILELWQFSLIRDWPEIWKPEIPSQGSINCMHGDKRARNTHAKRFSHARNYVYVNQSKHLVQVVNKYLVLLMLFKVVSYFCVWKQIIYSTIRSDIHYLFQLKSRC